MVNTQKTIFLFCLPPSPNLADGFFDFIFDNIFLCTRTSWRAWFLPWFFKPLPIA